MRFGLGMNSDHTLEEVGQQFAVTRERIRQIEAKASIPAIGSPSTSADRDLDPLPHSMGRERASRARELQRVSAADLAICC
jgi:hypothetical protein